MLASTKRLGDKVIDPAIPTIPNVSHIMRSVINSISGWYAGFSLGLRNQICQIDREMKKIGKTTAAIEEISI